ncbi:hypothetical protein AB0395_34875 [Streptosporangium sp. NPDC051023]|uniref:hypothetical protein n=1 Tax=Streptosporangium sp. NPDC051023 TaxID=3155410 RepID=UPI00344F9174
MVTEWGVFNDEGCIEDGIYSEEEAKAAAQGYRDRYDQDLENGDPHAEAKKICPDHPGQADDTCEECWGDE